MTAAGPSSARRCQVIVKLLSFHLLGSRGAEQRRPRPPAAAPPPPPAAPPAGPAAGAGELLQVLAAPRRHSPHTDPVRAGRCCVRRRCLAGQRTPLLGCTAAIRDTAAADSALPHPVCPHCHGAGHTAAPLVSDAGAGEPGARSQAAVWRRGVVACVTTGGVLARVPRCATTSPQQPAWLGLWAGWWQCCCWLVPASQSGTDCAPAHTTSSDHMQ